MSLEPELSQRILFFYRMILSLLIKIAIIINNYDPLNMYSMPDKYAFILIVESAIFQK
jgi:hypothetical protein